MDNLPYLLRPNNESQGLSQVTTCCRVPCFQNFSTYFDLDGNPDDCISQPFASMSVAVLGFVLLGLSLPALLMVMLDHVLKIKHKSRARSIIEETFCLQNRFPQVTTRRPRSNTGYRQRCRCDTHVPNGCDCWRAAGCLKRLLPDNIRQNINRPCVHSAISSELPDGRLKSFWCY